jgi:hypothetical protein
VDAQGFTEFCARLLTGKNDRDAALKAVDETQGRSRSMLEHKFEVLATLFMKGAGNTGHDALDVLNAVTEWVDHARGSREDEDELLTRAIARRTAVQRDIEDAVIVVDSVPEVLATADRRRVERRMQSSMLGSGRDLKNRARDLLMATVRDANPTGARRLTA